LSANRQPWKSHFVHVGDAAGEDCCLFVAVLNRGDDSATITSVIPKAGGTADIASIFLLLTITLEKVLHLHE
jgi:hypothetical protein